MKTIFIFIVAVVALFSSMVKAATPPNLFFLKDNNNNYLQFWLDDGYNGEGGIGYSYRYDDEETQRTTIILWTPDAYQFGLPMVPGGAPAYYSISSPQWFNPNLTGTAGFIKELNIDNTIASITPINGQFTMGSNLDNLAISGDALNYFTSQPIVPGVPEPASLMVLCLAPLMLVRR